MILSGSASPIRGSLSPVCTQVWRSIRIFPPRNFSIAAKQRIGIEGPYPSFCKGKPRADRSEMKGMPLQETIGSGKSATGPLRAWTTRLNLHPDNALQMISASLKQRRRQGTRTNQSCQYDFAEA